MVSSVIQWRWSVKSAVIAIFFVAYHANAFAASYRRRYSTSSSTRIISRQQQQQQQQLELIRKSSSSSFKKDGVDESSSTNNNNNHNWFDNNAQSALLQSSAKKTTRNAAGLAAAAVLVTAILCAPIQFQVVESFSTTTTTAATNIVPRKIVIVVPSQALALTENQMLVDNVWKEVTRQFVDQSFNGMGEDAWRKKRLEAVMKASEVGPDEQEEVYRIIRKMLGYLGDPYTRFLSPEQFETLTSFAKGTNNGNGGIGVQLIADPATGRIMVLNTIPGSPAEKGGLRPGDVIFEVDYMDMEGATAEVVAAKCRGDPGTEVSLAVRHGGDGKMANEMTRVAIARQVVKPRQVETSTIVSDSGKKIGVIQIPSFSLETEKQVREALGSVKKLSTSAIAIDLRGNVGGYMPAGVDVAKLFLPPQARIVSEVDKSGRATIYMNDGVGSDTKVPLYVLVDKKTASASEIFSAALQDNHRATIVGGSNTFGKGRIQNVQETINGCGVAVTKAKYFTPNGKDIQGKGIAPDIESALCGTDESVTSCLKGIV